jgi:hypothetical protein
MAGFGAPITGRFCAPADTGRRFNACNGDNFHHRVDGQNGRRPGRRFGNSDSRNSRHPVNRRGTTGFEVHAG